MSVESKIVNAISDIDSRVGVGNPFKDKWVSILGDSISTYNGWIPSDNATFYPKQDVTDVTKTWWHQLLTRLGAKLCVNDSSGGRRVCDSTLLADTSGYNNLHRKAGSTYVNLDGTTEEATETVYPDVILILLGINDFNAGTAVGTYNMSGDAGDYTQFAACYTKLLMTLSGYNYKDS